jgi:hypothetical protein
VGDAGRGEAETSGARAVAIFVASLNISLPGSHEPLADH